MKTFNKTRIKIINHSNIPCGIGTANKDPFNRIKIMLVESQQYNLQR